MRAFCTALLSDPYLYRFLSKRYAHAALIVPVLCNRLQRKKLLIVFFNLVLQLPWVVGQPLNYHLVLRSETVDLSEVKHRVDIFKALAV